MHTNCRSLLIALLLDMDAEEPDDVDLSELDDANKTPLLVSCCAQVIEVSIRAMSGDRDEARKGLDALIVSMRRNIDEGPYGNQRSH